MPDEQKVIRVQLNYPPDRVKEPIIYRLVTEFDIIPNIRRANIDTHTGGFIVLELTGADNAIQHGLRFLEELGISVSNVGVEGAQEWNV